MSASARVSAKRISGKVLQRLRSGRGLVQEEMAERLGKARSSLAGWEAGRGGLNLENLLSFLDHLGVTMEEFGRQFDALRRETRADVPHRETSALRGLGASPGAPVVLQVNQALVMLLPEQQQLRELDREGELLQPWVQDLFKRAERLFPGPEEMPEPGEAPQVDRSTAGGSGR